MSLKDMPEEERRATLARMEHWSKTLIEEAMGMRPTDLESAATQTRLAIYAVLVATTSNDERMVQLARLEACCAYELKLRDMKREE